MRHFSKSDDAAIRSVMDKAKKGSDLHVNKDLAYKTVYLLAHTLTIGHVRHSLTHGANNS